MTDVNLKAMSTIRDKLGVAVGYSDHTIGIEVSIAAVALGATVIEKHLTLNRNLPGPDHKSSLEPNEFKKMVINLIFTDNWLNEKIAHILANEEITQQQYNILRILRGSECPLSTLKIRERMLDKMSDTSRIVDRLIAKGLVEKTACLKDKRLVDITISKKGLVLVEKLDQFNNQIDAVLKGVDEKEAQTINQLLDKIRAISESKI
jgi:DNA-binding MarR family transcriptional regulator